MTHAHSSLALVAVFACSSPAQPTEAAPAPAAKPAPPPATSPPGHADVIKVGDAFAIGAAPLHVGGAELTGSIALSVRGNVVAVEDSHAARTWNLTTGEPNQTIAPVDAEPAALSPAIALSPDGKYLAIGATRGTHVTGPKSFVASCVTPHAFSRDSTLLVCDTQVLQVWSVAEQKLVAKAPDDGGISSPRDAQLTADQKAIVWVTDHEILRWDIGGKAATSLYKSGDQISSAAVSASGTHAVVSSHPPGTYKRTALLVELATGKTTPIGDAYTMAIAPSGTRVAVAVGPEVRVLDGAGKPVWTGKGAGPVQRLAFAGDRDDVLAFVENGNIHVVDVAKGERSYPQPSRFAGWAGEGAIATQRDGRVEKLDLATGTWSGLDRAPVESVGGAPAWATWVAAGVAAEPLAPDDACRAKLRVWTPKGGDRTITAPCTAGAPGWMLGGGWVGALAKSVVTVIDPVTGKTVASLPIEKPRPDFAHEYVAAAFAPTAVAVLSRGPQVTHGSGDPHEDALHQLAPKCEVDLTGDCWNEYFVTMYALDGAPAQRWQLAVRTDRPTELAPQASTIAIDHAGKRALIGTADGAIVIVSSATQTRVVRQHLSRIVRIVVSPGDGWAFSEDASGVQRVWKL